MFFKKEGLSPVLCLLLLFTFSETHLRGSDFWDGVVHGACIIGATAAGVAGVAKLASWCFSETDEQLIARSHFEYNHVVSKYGQEIVCFESMVHMPYGELACVSENIVYTLGERIWNSGDDQYSYRSELRTWRSTLRTTAKKLRDRIADIVSNYSGRGVGLNDMRLQAEKLEILVSRLQPYSDLLDCHESFYDLAWKEGKIQRYYVDELSALNMGYSSAILCHKLQECVAAHHMLVKYPYSAYIKKLESDIAFLRRAVAHLVYHYPVRVACVSRLVESLEYIKIVIASDPSYSREVFAKQQAELDEARRAAERARFQAEIARMEADRAHFDAMQERKRLQFERNNKEADRLNVDIVVNL